MTENETSPGGAKNTSRHAELIREAREQVKDIASDEDTPCLRADAGHVARTEPHPSRIGPYEIVELLGEGGMGTVYLAEQQEPICRRVALKVIKRGMDTDQVLARFEAERQALALMNHPNIAKVFDAGSTDDGRPYFVMEHVSGERINDYCDKHRLNTTERLNLFRHVCDGIQHAHQKAVIHRDIKPSNILVAEHDGNPVPKLIDFGVAKATQQRLTERTLFTEQGQLIGTPEYMSPEQAEMTAHDIDTQSDIYSLGVVLYELLAGALPFDRKKLRRAGLAEIQRIIREENPQKPSTRLSSLGDKSSTVAENRRTTRAVLERQLHGDLDWITMKAMEKDCTRRYTTATALADDIERHLNHEPVTAGPPSPSYRLRKFARRKRGIVVATSIVFLALAAGFTASAVFAIREKAAHQAESVQREKAERQTMIAQGVKDFLVGIFEEAKPGGSLQNATLPQSLDESVKLLHANPIEEPAIQADLLDTIGTIYYGYTRFDQADSLLTEALEIRRRELGDLDPATLSSVANVALGRQQQGKLDEAESLHREAVQGFRQTLGNNHKETLSAMNNLGQFLMGRGRLGEAAPLLRKARDGFEKLLGPEHEHSMSAAGNLAYVLRGLGRHKEAAETLRHLLDIQQHTLPAHHPARLRTVYYLASVLTTMNHLDDAESLLRNCPYVDPDNLSDPPVYSGALLKARADLYAKQHNPVDAESDYRFIVPVFDEAKNTSMADSARNGLAVVLREQGGAERYDEAESIWLQLLSAAKDRDDTVSRNAIANARKQLKVLYDPDHMNAPNKLSGIADTLLENSPSTTSTAGKDQ